MDVVLPEKKYGEAERVEFFREALQRVKSLPGVESVAAALKKFGITGATMAGGHGTNGKQSDLQAVMSQ